VTREEKLESLASAIGLLETKSKELLFASYLMDLVCVLSA